MPSQVVNPLILVSQLPQVALTDVTVVSTINDRDALTPDEGDICHVTTGDSMWVYNGSAWIVFTASSTLSGCTDVTITGIQDKQAIIYNTFSK